jgi:integrase
LYLSRYNINKKRERGDLIMNPINNKAEKISGFSKLKIELLDEFLTTAINTTPQIALAVYLQLFCQIRTNELLQLSVDDIRVNNKLAAIKVGDSKVQLRTHCPVIIYKDFFQIILDLKLKEIQNRLYKNNFLFNYKYGLKLESNQYSKLFQILKQVFINNCIWAKDPDLKKYGSELREMNFGREILRNTHIYLVYQQYFQTLDNADFSFEYYLDNKINKNNIDRRITQLIFKNWL